MKPKCERKKKSIRFDMKINRFLRNFTQLYLWNDLQFHRTPSEPLGILGNVWKGLSSQTLMAKLDKVGIKSYR